MPASITFGQAEAWIRAHFGLGSSLQISGFCAFILQSTHAFCFEPSATSLIIRPPNWNGAGTDMCHFKQFIPIKGPCIKYWLLTGTFTSHVRWIIPLWLISAQLYAGLELFGRWSSRLHTCSRWLIQLRADVSLISCSVWLQPWASHASKTNAFKFSALHNHVCIRKRDIKHTINFSLSR